MDDDFSRFDARSFLRTRYSNLEAERCQFYRRCFHEFYQKYHTQWDTTTTRLLEFGGGPSIVPLISAAPFVSEIVFAEYAESNRKEVQLWKDNNPNAYDSLLPPRSFPCSLLSSVPPSVPLSLLPTQKAMSCSAQSAV